MEVVLCVKGAGKELPVGFDQSNFHKLNEIMLSLSKNIKQLSKQWNILVFVLLVDILQI